MVYIPFIGRLAVQEYLALFFSFVLVLLESFISIVTLALPGPVIRLLYRGSRRAFNHLSSPQGRRNRNKKKAVVTSIAQASDFVELCELFGYYAEEHIVQTGDGYLLGLHRLGWRKGEENRRVNSGEGSLRKKVVYLHHGLLMNSEVWVCLTERERCLPFVLVERGYDVWLGNNRGNKYSKKSVKYAPTDTRFWNFSIDQFAFHDIPDSIDYILSTTGQASLSYIGFSQGTAQAFATLSIHPTLNDKVDVFIALAPAMSPKGLTSAIVNSLVKASPDVLFLTFGRRAILGSATMWQAVLYPPIFVRLIDSSLQFLFGWTGVNISAHQKLAAYPHLYSFTSTKSVVHWFQIIRNRTFQMYDDEVQRPFTFSNQGKYYKVAKFPTRNIKTPIVLVYGGSDSLVDINVMLKELPAHTIAKEIPHYEHLDFLWASSVDSLVYPHVFDALEIYTDPEARRNQISAGYRMPTIKKDAKKFSTFTDDSESYDSPFSPTTVSASHRLLRKISENVSSGYSNAQESGMSAPGTPNKSQLDYTLDEIALLAPTTLSSEHPKVGLGPAVTALNSRALSMSKKGFSSPAPSASQHTTRTTTSRPEGWWSSDEEGREGKPISPIPTKSPSRANSDGLSSGAEAKFGARGISLGAGKAVGGVTRGVGSEGGSILGVIASGGDRSEGKKKKGKKKD